MAKTLSIVQNLAKLGKVLSKIIFICCIVGAAGCALGLTLMPIVCLIAEDVVPLIEFNAEQSIGTIYAAMGVGMVFCVAEAVLSRFAVKYFTHQLAAGTPFTLPGANELLRLGILTIAISVGAVVTAAMVHGIFSLCMTNVADMELSNFGSVGLGIMFLLGSLLCRLGAESTGSVEIKG